jgi:diguanylate cyclase (GGDEF)-like protein
MNARGFVEETHLRRGTSVITAYAQVTIAHADPALRWGILIRVDRDSILAPIRSFLLKWSFLATLILLPLLGLVLGMIKALHGEWGTAKREFQRATDAEAALKKRTEALHTLVVAAQTFSAQQDLDELLHHLLEIARESTGARYAALGVDTDNMREPTQFLTAGTDDAAACTIRTLPLEQGAWESLGQENGALRLSHLTKHWAALGFPADHAPMTSFLGVSIQCQNQFFGRLFLANKVTAHGLAVDFSELDEQVVLTLAAQAGTAIQNLQLLQESKEEARHDSLTGLLNHLTILTVLTQELSRAQRSRYPVAVLIADLDHFKGINDTYGHPVGDVVIREVARRLRETARRYDHVGRVGGEEFLIVAPNCDLNALRECAERFRIAISDVPFDTPSGLLTITVSIGATVWSSEHPLSSERLRKMADYALYRVKSHGRNGIDIVPHPHALVTEQMKKAG